MIVTCRESTKVVFFLPEPNTEVRGSILQLIQVEQHFLMPKCCPTICSRTLCQRFPLHNHTWQLPVQQTMHAAYLKLMFFFWFNIHCDEYNRQFLSTEFSRVIIFCRICNKQEKLFFQLGRFFQTKTANFFYSKINDSSRVRTAGFSSSRFGVWVSVMPNFVMIYP